MPLPLTMNEPVRGIAATCEWKNGSELGDRIGIEIDAMIPCFYRGMATRHGFEEFKASYRHCFDGLTVAHFALLSLTLAISPRGVLDALH
ncbi:MAG: hypothetical protein WCC90_18820 [Methylocella sp.]